MVTGKPSNRGGRPLAKAKPAKRRRVPRLVVPEAERQRLVAAAAFFRAARYRDIGADGCRDDDRCKVASELDAVFRRHHVRQ